MRFTCVRKNSRKQDSDCRVTRAVAITTELNSASVETIRMNGFSEDEVPKVASQQNRSIHVVPRRTSASIDQQRPSHRHTYSDEGKAGLRNDSMSRISTHPSMIVGITGCSAYTICSE